MNPKVLNEQTLEAWKNIDPQGWQKLVNEIIDIFLKTAPPQFENLRHLCQREDWMGVKKIAHSLKSSCGNVGAESSYVIMNEIERMSEKDTDVIPNLIQQVEPMFSQLLVQLDDYRRKIIGSL